MSYLSYNNKNPIVNNKLQFYYFSAIRAVIVFERILTKLIDLPFKNKT